MNLSNAVIIFLYQTTVEHEVGEVLDLMIQETTIRSSVEDSYLKGNK